MEQFKTSAETAAWGQGAYVNTKRFSEFKDFVAYPHMPTRIYMDANAGTPLLPEVRDAVIAALGDAANPSSIHAAGRKARGLVEDARVEHLGSFPRRCF